VRFGPKPLLTTEVVKKIKELRADGATVPEIMRRTKLSKRLSIERCPRNGSQLDPTGVAGKLHLLLLVVRSGL
jgi:hypothetical protein